MVLHSPPPYVLREIIYLRICAGLALDLEETQMTFDPFMLESTWLTKALFVAPRVGKKFEVLRSAACFWFQCISHFSTFTPELSLRRVLWRRFPLQLLSLCWTLPFTSELPTPSQCHRSRSSGLSCCPWRIVTPWSTIAPWWFVQSFSVQKVVQVCRGVERNTTETSLAPRA